MRLIDDTITKIYIWGLFNDVYNDASRFTEEEIEFAKQILSKVQEQIDDSPTAFDLESAIEQIEKSNIHTIETYTYGCPMEEDFISVCDAIKIIKSAANATNGKNGG